MNGRKVLVTGLGFIGHHVVEELVRRDFYVGVLERKPILQVFAGLGVSPVVGDVRDAELLSHTVPEFDGVIHLAGLLGTSELIDDPIPAIQTNITGAVNVFEACRRAAGLGRPVPCVHITAANYFMENTYSITKHASERFATMFSREHGTDIRVVRAQNVYGERQKHYPVQKIVPKFIRAALRGEPLRIYGNGEQVQDMVYVGDVARVLVKALLAPRIEGVLSVGTGRTLRVNELARMVIQAAHSQSSIEHVPMRPGEPPQSMVLGDPSTLGPLGIVPESLTPFEEGIRKTVQWYREHPAYLT